MGSNVPKLACRARLCFAIGLIFFIHISWYSQFGSLPWLDLSRHQLKVIWVLMCLRQLLVFKFLTRTMMSSGFWSSSRMYCYRFLLNFLYGFLDSLCSAMVPKTTPESPTSILKFLIDDVYVGRSEHPSRPLRPWWPPPMVRTPLKRPWTLLLALDSLIPEARVIVTSLPSPLLIPAAGEAVSVSCVNIGDLPFWILLNLHSYPSSVWDITPCVLG